MKASKVLQKVGLALGRAKKNPNDEDDDDDESFSDESGSEDDDSFLSDSIDDNAASEDYYSSSYDDSGDGDDETSNYDTDGVSAMASGSVFSESTGGYTTTTPTATAATTTTTSPAGTRSSKTSSWLLRRSPLNLRRPGRIFGGRNNVSAASPDVLSTASPDSDAVKAADALGKDLETMGYNLDCQSFITKDGGSKDLSEAMKERYVAPKRSSTASMDGDTATLDPVMENRSANLTVTSTVSSSESLSLPPSQVAKSRNNTAPPDPPETSSLLANHVDPEGGGAFGSEKSMTADTTKGKTKGGIKKKKARDLHERTVIEVALVASPVSSSNETPDTSAAGTTKFEEESKPEREDDDTKEASATASPPDGTTTNESTHEKEEATVNGEGGKAALTSGTSLIQQDSGEIEMQPSKGGDDLAPPPQQVENKHRVAPSDEVTESTGSFFPKPALHIGTLTPTEESTKQSKNAVVAEKNTKSEKEAVVIEGMSFVEDCGNSSSTYSEDKSAPASRTSTKKSADSSKSMTRAVLLKRAVEKKRKLKYGDSATLPPAPPKPPLPPKAKQQRVGNLQSPISLPIKLTHSSRSSEQEVEQALSALKESLTKGSSSKAETVEGAAATVVTKEEATQTSPLPIDEPSKPEEVEEALTETLPGCESERELSTEKDTTGTKQVVASAGPRVKDLSPLNDNATMVTPKTKGSGPRIFGWRSLSLSPRKNKSRSASHSPQKNKQMVKLASPKTDSEAVVAPGKEAKAVAKETKRLAKEEAKKAKSAKNAKPLPSAAVAEAKKIAKETKRLAKEEVEANKIKSAKNAKPPTSDVMPAKDGEKELSVLPEATATTKKPVDVSTVVSPLSVRSAPAGYNSMLPPQEQSHEPVLPLTVVEEAKVQETIAPPSPLFTLEPQVKSPELVPSGTAMAKEIAAPKSPVTIPQAEEPKVEGGSETTKEGETEEEHVKGSQPNRVRFSFFKKRDEAKTKIPNNSQRIKTRGILKKRKGDQKKETKQLTPINEEETSQTEMPSPLGSTPKSLLTAVTQPMTTFIDCDSEVSEDVEVAIQSRDDLDANGMHRIASKNVSPKASKEVDSKLDQEPLPSLDHGGTGIEIDFDGSIASPALANVSKAGMAVAETIQEPVVLASSSKRAKEKHMAIGGKTTESKKQVPWNIMDSVFGSCGIREGSGGFETFLNENTTGLCDGKGRPIVVNELVVVDELKSPLINAYSSGASVVKKDVASVVKEDVAEHHSSAGSSLKGQKSGALVSSAVGSQTKHHSDAHAAASENKEAPVDDDESVAKILDVEEHENREKVNVVQEEPVNEEMESSMSPSAHSTKEQTGMNAPKDPSVGHVDGVSAAARIGSPQSSAVVLESIRSGLALHESVKNGDNTDAKSVPSFLDPKKNPDAAKLLEFLANRPASMTSRSKVPSRLIIDLDYDEGSCLTSVPDMPVKMEKSKGVEIKPSMDSNDAFAWEEIARASLIVENAIKSFRPGDGGDAKSFVSTVGEEIEKALETLSKHAERLGVKESDLLLAVRSNDDMTEAEVLSTASKQVPGQAEGRDDRSRGSVDPNASVHSDNTLTFGEEILEAFKMYIKQK